MTKLAVILDQIDSGSVLLPEFQRGYVWHRDQVRALMRSLYLGYPVGSLLTWETQADGALVRGEATSPRALRVLILDGQQRITSLYGVVRGRPPAFFEGDESAFSGLRFNVADETFEFYAPAKMRDDPRWIDVTSLYTQGLEPHIATLHASPLTRPHIAGYMQRLARLWQAIERDLHEEKITGKDKTVDVVIDIFNRVNSGGTKLSKGDIALAKKCAQWPEARATMRTYLDQWEKQGFSFTLNWLLRNTTAIATGRAELSALDAVSVDDFRQALADAAGCINQFLDIAATNFGLDHEQVLMGRYSFPVICRLLHLAGGDFADAAETSCVLYWYVHSALWGRYAGSTESLLNRDCETAGRSGIDGLIDSLERWRGGNLIIDAHDFAASGKGSRFYPLLYLLSRVHGGRDLGSGLPLPALSIGGRVHSVFPKSALDAAGYEKTQVNAVVNLCFLSAETSMIIGRRSPQAYFGAVEARHPGVLASQWLPEDPALRRVDRYPDFLAARRELLAAAANEFLTQLRAGAAPGALAGPARAGGASSGVADRGRLTLVTTKTPAPPNETPVSPRNQIRALIAELADLGCADPATDCEVSDPATGEVLAIAQACWPEGLRSDQGAPVILTLNPPAKNLPRLRELGYQVFTSPATLRTHAEAAPAQPPQAATPRPG